METESSQTKSGQSNKKFIGVIAIIAAVILIIGIVLIIVFTSASGDDDDAGSTTSETIINSTNNNTITVIDDVAFWGYNIILSKEIDSTGLEHGIIYKQLNLTQQSTGINRLSFNEMYVDDGPSDHTQSWLNAQSRTVYDYALAYEQTKDRKSISDSDREKFLEYAVNGMEGIKTYFYDNVYGGYFRSVKVYNNGTVEIAQDWKDSYQHFFLIKALSKLYQITLNETYLNEALSIYQLIWTNFTDQTGVGPYPTLTRDFSNSTDGIARNTDPVLHFFHSSQKLWEAYETYYDVNNNANETILDYLEQKINTLYNFVMSIHVQVNIIDKYTDAPRTFSVVCLNYIYSEADNIWIADPSFTNQLDNMVVGHGFEFALFFWRFMDYGVIAKTDENILNANLEFQWSVDLSFNRTTGALDILYHVDFDMSTYWWHQTQWWVGIEAIRTITYFDVNYDNLDISDIYVSNDYVHSIQTGVVAWFNEIFYDETYGGIYHSGINMWRQKGFEWKVGYHTIEALFDVLNFLEFDY